MVEGVSLGVEAVRDLLLLDRPSQEALARERELDRTGGQPGSKLKLTERIGQRVGGLNHPNPDPNPNPNPNPDPNPDPNPKP